MRRIPLVGQIIAAVLICTAGISSGDLQTADAADKPTALVFEFVDPHTRGRGAREALERAGFQVNDLSLRSSPASARADLIVLGTFVSEHPEYAAYMKKHGKALGMFAQKGGVIFAGTQAEKTEVATPFLPQPLRALRSSDDLTDMRVRAKDHPLLKGLERDEKLPDRLRMQRLGGSAAYWEALAWQEGFRVVLATGDRKNRFALLEASHGKGRILLSALHVDKGLRPDGSSRFDENGARFADQFFANLATYVMGMKTSAPELITPTPPPTREPSQLTAPQSVAWKLGRSDVLEFDRVVVRILGQARLPGSKKQIALHGHDVHADGRWQPRDFRRSDLETALAFLLPAPSTPGASIDLTFPVHQTIPVRVSGTLTSHRIGTTNTAWLRGDYTFESKGRGDKEDKHRIAKGTARVRAVFDLEQGFITSSELDLAYDLFDLNAKRRVPPKHETRAFDWALKSPHRHQRAGFHDDVDAAILKGVAWLRTERKHEERWKPHGNYDIGTQALVLLTLLACDVPRDDPVVKGVTDWIFEQSPQRTYERAVCLMAIDKFYAPPGEAPLLRAGQKVKRERNLPPDRRKWVEENAAALQEIASQPGSWGYPNGGRDLQRFDTSNTQYAVLGLRAASHMDVHASEGTWLGVLRHFEIVRESNRPRGSVALVREGQAIPDESKTTLGALPVKQVAGFRYSPLYGHRNPWGSMTCAGIGSLAIARHQLKALGSSKMTPKMEQQIEDAIVGAWAWLDVHWAVDRHPRKGRWFFYYLYSLERAGILHGVKRVGGRDWYFSGATELLIRQKDKGQWGRLAETCFALLFLKRATSPLTGR